MGGVIQIPLTRGQIAIIDADDAANIASFRWFAWPTKNGHFYAARCVKRKMLFMHRLILNAPQHLLGDHRDGNSLDNRRANLRLATKGQNCCNRHGLDRNNTSGVRGVMWYKRHRKWTASIRVNGKLHHLGYFPNINDAVEVRKRASREYYGEFSPEVQS